MLTTVCTRSFFFGLLSFSQKWVLGRPRLTTGLFFSVAPGGSIATEGKGEYLYVHGRILDTKVSEISERRERGSVGKR
jgi:hypothetical protein